jgi:major membrane immunogen (membrane-anchored lipoprotein)
MNKLKSVFIAVAILTTTVSLSFYRGDHLKLNSKAEQDTLQTYPDGNYSGQSRSMYIDEPYWGSVRFTLKNGQYTGISFIIRDSSLHEAFDSVYEKHFQGNDLYIQQCRNDWKGVQTYPKKLIEIQDINKVDATTGATWSYNIFKATVKDAMNKAGKGSE